MKETSKTQSAPKSAPAAGEQQSAKAAAANADALATALRAAGHALRSYQYGNSSPDLAAQTADSIDALLADRAAATSTAALDAARLDFMVQHEAWVAFGKDGESCRVFSRNEDGDAVPMLGWGARHWRHDPREAIDAAMTFVGFRAAAKGTAGQDGAA